VIAEIKKAAKSADKVYLALARIAKERLLRGTWRRNSACPRKTLPRALQRDNEGASSGDGTPHKIDINKVDAQQARRVLTGLSLLVTASLEQGEARPLRGRVQSVAVRLVCGGGRDTGLRPGVLEHNGALEADAPPRLRRS
jgi:hypothetical protein